jgi:hypothetical protein
MAVQLLDATEEAELDPWGGKTWLSTASSWRRKTRDRLLEAIDRLVEFQEDVGAPNPLEPLVLSQLMTVVLRHDKAFIGQFEKRKPANPDWERLCFLMARALVQRWSADRDLSTDDILATSAWTVSPDYLDALGALLELAKDEGAKANLDVAEDMPSNEWASELPDDPEFIASTEAAIRAVLEQHEDLAHESADGEIPLAAQEREIEKAALLDLRYRDLKAVAEAHGVPVFKSKDRLAEAIVNHTDLTREQIAELVLQHYPADPFDRGMTTHLVPLNDPPDIGDATGKLERLAGRYARLRVARWFVFQNAAHPTPQQLVIKGQLRGYRTKAVLDTDDYKVNATPQRTEVRARLREGTEWAEVDARHVADVRDMRVVLNRGAEVQTSASIVPELEPMEGVLAAWDSKSVWFLDFLSRALEDDNTEIFNFEMAHFERVGGPGDDPGKPQIDKVELRGQHIGSHRDSCSLITAGRRLMEVVVKLRFRANAQQDFLIPVQISLFPDRATIATAAARDVPSTAIGELHRDLVRKVRLALEREVKFDEIDGLAQKIVGRAEQASPAEEADLFAPQDAVDGDAPGPVAPIAPSDS